MPKEKKSMGKRRSSHVGGFGLWGNEKKGSVVGSSERNLRKRGKDPHLKVKASDP